VYYLVLGWLAIGVIKTAGEWQQVSYLFYYAVVCGISYCLSSYVLNHFKNKSFFKLKMHAQLFISIALLFTITVALIQFIKIGNIPLFTAYFSTDAYDIAKIRQAITLDSPSWLNYLTSFCIRAILPLLLLVSLYIKRYDYFWISVLLSFLFCCSLLQKSYIALVFIPTLLYSLYIGAWKYFFAMIVVAFTSVMLLVVITNPQIRINHLNGTKQQQIGNKSEIAVNSVLDRILIVPGKVVSQWFTLIPETIPFGHGCGDRLLAKILHCQHINYSEKVYEQLYPLQLEEGLLGTVNAASFMEGYANFGLSGMLLSGIELGFWFAFISLILTDFSVLALLVNALFILLLSSASFHTLLLSGGWMLTLVLVYLVRDEFKNLDVKCVV
jgi:hypothetical protein